MSALPLLLASAPAASGDEASGGAPLGFVQVALVIFVLVFVGIVAWVLVRGRKHFEPHARIPLEDEPVETRAGRDSSA